MTQTHRRLEIKYFFCALNICNEEFVHNWQPQQFMPNIKSLRNLLCENIHTKQINYFVSWNPNLLRTLNIKYRSAAGNLLRALTPKYRIRKLTKLN